MELEYFTLLRYGHKKNPYNSGLDKPKKKFNGTAKHVQTSRVHKSEFPKRVYKGPVFVSL